MADSFPSPEWTLSWAKGRFSEFARRVDGAGPLSIARRGAGTLVAMTEDEHACLKRPDQPGHIKTRHEAERRSVSPVDALIAAATIVHDLTLVTRNVRDFEHSGCRVLSPWSA